MKYTDIKISVAEMVDEFQKGGLGEEAAETRVLQSGIKMFKEEKIGFMDLKYMFQILGYEYLGDLKKTMEDIKKGIRNDFGIDDILRAKMKSGKSREEAEAYAIEFVYESFVDGSIEEPEILDMVLWSLGYRLTDGFLCLDKEDMKKGIDYEVDD